MIDLSRVSITRYWPTMDRGFAPYRDPQHSPFYERLHAGMDERTAAECLLSVGDHAPEQA